MLRERARWVAATLMAGDLAAATAGFWIAYLVRSQLFLRAQLASGALFPLERYYFLLPLGLVFWALSLAAVGAYRSHRIKSLAYEVGEVASASVLSGMLLVIVLFFFRLDRYLLSGDQVSRAFLLLWILTAAGLIATVRISVRLLARSARRRGHNFRNILIVGSSPAALQIARTLRVHQHWGLHVVGLIADDFISFERVEGFSILGGFEQLVPTIENRVVDEVILAPARASHRDSMRVAQELQERGVSASVALPTVFERRVRSEIADVGGVRLLKFQSAPASQLELAVKRSFDLAIGSLLLIAFSPFMTLMALAIRVSSPGKVIFRQNRVGLNGRQFTLFKFRTMAVDAEGDRGQLTPRNEMSGPVFKLRSDPRITRVGRTLRRFSFDELPQLWNVIKGEMSLVGPRPPLPEEVEEYEPWQRRRLSMRPGLTGPWQVAGRNEIDFERWMKMDLSYIDNWSLWLDLKILFRTVPAVFSGRGAY